MSDFIPDDKFVPDAQSAQQVASGPDFIPDSHFESDEDKYGTLPQQLKTAAEGAASAATFGLSTGLEKALFNNEKDIQARREENPISYGAGQIAGIAATPVGGMLGAAGEGAAKLAGIGAETVGQRLGAAALKSGIEGALVQSGDEVSKMFSGAPGYDNPGEAAQTALANVGIGGLLGGGFGLAGKGLGELWGATKGRLIESSLGAAKNAIEATTPATGTIGTQLGELSDLVNQKTARAAEDIAAADRLGIELPTGSTSSSKLIRDISQSLSEKPVIGGVPIAKEYKQAFDKLEKAAQETLRDQTVYSRAKVGEEIKNGLEKSFQEEFKPVQDTFKRLESKLKSVPVPDELKLDALKPILEDDSLKFNKAAKKAVADEMEALAEVKNVNQLKTYRTELNRKISEAFPNVGPMKPEGSALLKVKGVINEIKDKSLQQGIEQGHISSNDVGEHYMADNAYSQIKNKLKQTGVEANLGRLNDVRSMMSRIKDIPDEKIADKFFNTDDITSLNYLKEHLPKEYDLARRYALKELAVNSIDHRPGELAKFSVTKYLGQINKLKPELNPEAFDALFSGQGNKVMDIRRVVEAIPGIANPSGTAKGISFSKLFTPAGAVENLGSIAQLALLKAQPHLEEAIVHAGGGEAATLAALKMASSAEKDINPTAFQQMTNYISQTIKGENALSKGVKAIFSAGEPVAASTITDKIRDKLDEKLKGLQADNSPLLDVGGQVGHYLPDHGTSLAQTASSAVNYLNSLRPDTSKQGPLDSEPKVNKAKQAEFNRALDIAQQPLIVLNAVKHGTVTMADLTHFKNLYPDLYTRTASKMMHQMMEVTSKGVNVPYKTRMGLSMFSGQPLDSTMTPMAIQSAQPKLAQPMQQMQGSGGKSKGSLKSLDKFSLSYQTPGQHRQTSMLKH